MEPENTRELLSMTPAELEEGFGRLLPLIKK